MCVIVEFADIDEGEIFEKVFPNYKENSVFVLFSRHVFVMEQLFVGGTDLIPEIEVVVRSTAFPLLVAPGITKFNEAHRLIVYTKLN
jgi:hypothetical protein